MKKDGNTVRTRFCVEGMKPDLTSKNADIASLVKIHNFKKNETRDAKGALKKDEEYVFLMQLYTKDYSNFLSNSFVRLLLCDRESSKTSFFKGIKPSDLLKKKDA
jgi:hypothetical protein